MFTLKINSMLFRLVHEQCKENRITGVSYSKQFGAEYRRTKKAYIQCVEEKVSLHSKKFSAKMFLMSFVSLFS